MMSAAAATIGLSVLEMARARRFGEICDLFLPSLRAMVSPDALRAGWDHEISRCGPVTSVGEPVSEPGQAGTVLVRVPLRCERGGLTLLVSVAPSGQVAGVQLGPPAAAEPAAPWEPPDYADPDAFHEEEVTIGSGPLGVGGTLSLPDDSREPVPAAVLLAGSGPNDRDGTVGRNKPLKDLAWGLVSRGVAVLRFDKVTYAHPREVSGLADFTLADEYLPHAVAAVELLGRHPGVDAARVVLVGHSLGGTVAPRVAAAAPTVAGLVILAGGTEPLHWAAVRQVRYLASLNPDTAAASAPVVEAMSEQARRVDSPELSRATLASDLPFGVPAAYWLDLRSYQPVSAAGALGRPMLILQGGRDYQVTVSDDLVGWQTGLSGRPDVTIRVHPDDNHFFFRGSGPSTAAESEPAQHVDPAVVSDVAGWITGLPRSKP